MNVDVCCLRACKQATQYIRVQFSMENIACNCGKLSMATAKVRICLQYIMMQKVDISIGSHAVHTHTHTYTQSVYANVFETQGEVRNKQLIMFGSNRFLSLAAPSPYGLLNPSLVQGALSHCPSERVCTGCQCECVHTCGCPCVCACVRVHVCDLRTDAAM